MKVALRVIGRATLVLILLSAGTPAQESDMERVTEAYWFYDREKSIQVADEVLQNTTDDEVIIAAKYLKAMCYRSSDRESESETILDELLQEYPNEDERFFWIADKLTLGISRIEDEEQRRQRELQAYEGMIAYANAPPPNEFLADPLGVLGSLQAQGAERRFLMDVYGSYASVVDDDELDRDVLKGRRENDQGFGWSRFYWDLVHLIPEPRPEPEAPADTDQKTPVLFEQTTSVPRADPVLTFRLKDGGYGESQIDLESLKVSIDGTPYESYSISTDLHFALDAPYLEILTISVPIQVLTPGQYQARVIVKDGVGRQIDETWTFSITNESQQEAQTLPTTRDTTLLIRNPHQNEGANPRLHLKKETGKPAQVLVGFNTANIDTNGLTKATLVLNIDSTQNVTGWGNGRPIRAQRLLTAWTEGNGKTLDMPNNQKTAPQEQLSTPGRGK